MVRKNGVAPRRKRFGQHGLGELKSRQDATHRRLFFADQQSHVVPGLREGRGRQSLEKRLQVGDKHGVTYLDLLSAFAFLTLAAAAGFFGLAGEDALPDFTGVLRAAVFCTPAFDTGVRLGAGPVFFAAPEDLPCRTVFALAGLPWSSLRNAVKTDCSLPFTPASWLRWNRDHR
jgi:hypothetical protein